jgi:hypothetical protein
MSIWNTLSEQLPEEYSKATHLAPHLVAFKKIRQLSEEVSKHRQSVEAPGTLNARGITEAIRGFAASKVVPELRRQQYRLEKAEKALAERRLRLGVPVPDKTDTAGAMLRAEVRSYLRELEPAERTALLMVNPSALVVSAVFEAPNFLSGVSDELRAQAEQAIVENSAPDDLAKIEEEREAIGVAGMGLEIAVRTIQDEVGFKGDTRAFDDWMAEASVSVEREVRAGARKASQTDLDALLAQVKTLDKDQRFALTDAALDFDPTASAHRAPFNPTLSAG